jgi:hypothetical protein
MTKVSICDHIDWDTGVYWRYFIFLGHLEVFFWLLVQNYINRIKEQRIFNHFLPCTFFVVCDDEDFFYFNGLCLFISKSAKNWTDAISYCEVMGGNLVLTRPGLCTLHMRTIAWPNCIALMLFYIILILLLLQY